MEGGKDTCNLNMNFKLSGNKKSSKPRGLDQMPDTWGCSQPARGLILTRAACDPLTMKDNCDNCFLVMPPRHIGGVQSPACARLGREIERRLCPSWPRPVLC